MPGRGGKSGRGGDKGKRGGHFNSQSSRGGARGSKNSRRGYNTECADLYDDDNDDYLSLVGRNHQHQQRQRSTEEEIYSRIQRAKAGRKGGNEGILQSTSGNREGLGFIGFRPVPKQNGNGKKSKHHFWPPPSDYKSNDIRNNRTFNSRGESSKGASQYSKPRSVVFNRATSLTDPTVLRQDEDYNQNQDQDQDQDQCQKQENNESDQRSEYESEIDSSDDLINREVDEDESDEEFLMQQFNWIEEDNEHEIGNGASSKTDAQEHHKQQQKQQQQQRIEAQQAVADILGEYMEPLAISALDVTMTQSEELIQAIEAEGNIKVHADEIENLSESISETTYEAQVQAEVVGVASSKLETVQDGALLESCTQAVEVKVTSTFSDGVHKGNNSNSNNKVKNKEALANMETIASSDPRVTPITEKPKKKAHRSKRGGRNQKERQLNKQMIVGNDDDGPMMLEGLSEDEKEEDDMSAIQDYIANTKDAESLGQLESLLGALKGLHTGRNGHSKDIGGLEPDDSDYEQQVSGGFDTEQDDDCDFDEDELDYDFEQDYEDNIRTTKKLDFRKGGVSIMSDKRQRRKVDDLLRDELENILPLWRSGAIQDGDGASRRFASRAKGYDIYDSDDDFLLASSVAGGKQKKKKNSNKKKEPHGGSFETLMDLNRQIEHFVKDRSSDNLHLPPMPKPLRRKIHLLCNHYNLKSESVGSGKRRYPILIKTDRTKMPINPVNVNKLLNQSENELKALSIQFQGSNSRKSGYEHGNGNNGNSGGGRGGQGGYKDNRNNKKGRNSGSSMAVPGSIVGASASAISVDNVGHRMLSKLGWTPGVGLGATGEGITQPIEAIIRAKNRGLGHE